MSAESNITAGATLSKILSFYIQTHNRNNYRVIQFFSV